MEISDEYQDLGNPGGGVAIANGMSLEHHRHSPDSPMSHHEEDLSDPDLQDEESGEELPQQPHQANTHSSDSSTIPTSAPTPLAHLNSLMNAHHPHFLAKLKMESDMEMLNNKSSIEALQAAMGTGTFNLPFSFPPPAAFLTPQHHNNHHHSGIGTGNVANNAVASSADSHSSESSQGSARNASDARETSGNQSQNNNSNNNNSHQQQTSWSFEEQFKQLYEINDDPKRKEFLDDLFSYMQKRGTPINRLPIMAKSVLDLYELYNLVIARGGLVDVINKKLWQEIIKGLHLPSSITSAAFTLRTQYMKYLYPYECEKLRLSSPAELQAAIDGNRREGRRSSYGAYAGGTGPISSMVPMDLEARMVEYVKLINKEMRIVGSRTPPPIINRQASPPATPPRDMAPFSALEMSRLTLWNMYNNNTLYSGLGHQPQHPLSPQTSQSPNPQSSSPEPQREALDLGLRSPPMSTSPSRQSPTTSAGTNQTKRDKDIDEDGPSAPKRPFTDDEMLEKSAPLVLGANIKITNRNDGGNGDHSLSVSIELNGTTYQGVLFPQGDSHNAPSTTTNHQKTLA